MVTPYAVNPGCCISLTGKGDTIARFAERYKRSRLLCLSRSSNSFFGDTIARFAERYKRSRLLCLSRSSNSFFGDTIARFAERYKRL